MSQTSCIRHPANARFLKIYQWQLDFCDGNACAAALMSYFEFCHNGKLQQLQQSKTLNDELEKTPQGRTQVETLLQWHTLQTWKKPSCSTSGTRSRKGLSFWNPRVSLSFTQIRTRVSGLIGRSITSSFRKGECLDR